MLIDIGQFDVYTSNLYQFVLCMIDTYVGGICTHFIESHFCTHYSFNFNMLPNKPLVTINQNPQ